MKKIGLFCITILAGLSLAGCNNLASQSHKTTSSSSSIKVVKHHKGHKQANKASHKNKQSSSSSSQATANNNATSQQGNNGNQQATTQSNNSKDSLNQSRLIKVMVSRYTQHIHRRAVQYTRPMAMQVVFKATQTRLQKLK